MNDYGINLDNKAVDELKVAVGGGSGIEYVPIDIEATSISQETLDKLVDFGNNTLKPNFIVLTTKRETDTFPILMPSDNLQYVYRSVVMDGKYYQLTLTILEEGANVSIQTVSVGGGAPKYKHHIIFALSDFDTCFLYAVEFDIVNNDANTHFSRTYDDIVSMVTASPDLTLPCTLTSGSTTYSAFILYDVCYGDHPLVFRALTGINYDESATPISLEYDTWSPEKSTFLFISETVQDN